MLADPIQRHRIRQWTIATTLPLAVLTAAPAIADLPTYSTVELQARARFSDAFNMPPGSAFTSGTPAIGDNGPLGPRVAVRLITVGLSGISGAWTGGSGEGDVIYQAPNDIPAISDPSVNTHGEVVFQQFDFSSSDGVFRYDPKTDETTLTIAPGGPLNIQGFGSPQIIDDGRIAFRASIFGGQAHVVDDGGKQTIYIAANSIDPDSPYTFLFTPSFNQAGEIASKAQIGSGGSGGNEIHIFHSDGSSTFIAADQTADPTSLYASFDNSVSLTDDGRVAFTASLGGGVRGVFLHDGGTITEIATTEHPLVSEIEFFAPSANTNGHVAFRAFDNDGQRAIFIGDGSDLKRVIGHFGPVLTDLGDGMIARPDSSPVFGGNARLNNQGDIAFNASITPLGNSSTSWGSGIFVIYTDVTAIPGDLDDDGVVDGADLALLLGAWGACADCDDCDADLDGNCTVDGADLAVLLGNWG